MDERKKDQYRGCLVMFMYFCIGLAVGSFITWYLASPYI